MTCACGCGTPVRARYVSGHNMRSKRPTYSVADRGHTSPCWIWQGKPEGDNGYGRLRVNGRRTPAHRFFYEQANGAIPEGLQLDHLCRIPLCVNPAHLEPVTGTENVRRGNVAALTTEAAAAIRAFRDEYFSKSPLNTKGQQRRRLPQGILGALAEKYGVSKPAIGHVLRDRTWVA